MPSYRVHLRSVQRAAAPICAICTLLIVMTLILLMPLLPVALSGDTSIFMLNHYRQLGDATHMLAKFLLLRYLVATRRASGVSLRSQQLQLFTFLLRYTDLFTTFYSVYNSAMKARHHIFRGSEFRPRAVRSMLPIMA